MDWVSFIEGMAWDFVDPVKWLVFGVLIWILVREHRKGRRRKGEGFNPLKRDHVG